MKMLINVPVEKIYPREGVYTFRSEKRLVDVRYIERISANKKRTAFYYMVHYVRAIDELNAHNNSNINSLARANLDRKINKFNPKKFEFIDDLAKVEKQ